MPCRRAPALGGVVLDGLLLVDPQDRHAHAGEVLAEALVVDVVVAGLDHVEAVVDDPLTHRLLVTTEVLEDLVDLAAGVHQGFSFSRPGTSPALVLPLTGTWVIPSCFAAQ